MAEHTPWRVLHSGDPADLVLAVDFFSPGRAEGAFSDLAPMLDGPYSVWETLQPAPGDETGMSGDDYLDRWLDALPRDAVVRGVLGFCVGGIYGSALGERIAARQGRPPVTVLFDPEPVSPFVLYWQYHKLVDRLAGVLAPEEVQAAQLAGHQVQESESDPVVVGAALVELYREYGSTGLERVGLDAARRAELMALFESYLAYLVAATQVATARDVSTSTVVSSDTPVNGLHLGAREVPFAIDRHDLLRRPEVAAAVSDLLAAR
ncbi:hypothetical protein ABZW03_27825 [Kitasatospora sp. NPDC004799]|uniref:hypothetical protein n=1 Tax=Kitasatospora sp. NPDC004799 TaxID=3154460 RepID=UPI0033B24090